MPGEENGLLDAINAGIAQANGTSAPAASSQESSSDSSEGAAGDAAAAAGNDPAGDGAVGSDDASLDAGANDGEGGDVGDGAGSDAAGEDGADADGEKAGADNQKGKPAGEKTPATDGQAKAPDPLNDPLPNALKAETKERIRTLIGMTRENEARAVRAETNLNGLMETIEQSTATPAQYGQALDYIRLVNSNQPGDREKAYEMMQQELHALAILIGKPLPGVNLLQKHTDLMQEVATGKISLDRAHELAAARENRAYQERRHQGERQQSDETAAMQTERRNAMNGLNQLEQQLKTDPHWAAKKPIVVAQMKKVFPRLRPSEWVAAFKDAYDALPAPVAPVRTASPANKPAVPGNGAPRNTPLRGSNPAGGATPAPKTMAEAIDLGIAAARR